jgi:hypothetical protein
MSTENGTSVNQKTLERQVRRLRDCLADAWTRGPSPRVIHRLEAMMARRCNRLEQAQNRKDLDDLQPA